MPKPNSAPQESSSRMRFGTARPYGNPHDVDIIVEKSGKRPEEFLTPAGLAVYEAMKAEATETGNKKED